ncbi:MAG: branched-chain amino acid ABC transporter permease [Candidatus Gracilibacteria bacterium]
MLEILPQVLWYSLVASAIYTLIAIGLTLIFGVLGFINFAHGEMAMIGAYVLLALLVQFKLPFWLAFVLAFVFVAILGVVLEKLTFKKVRKSHPFKPLVISIGVSAFLQAVVILIFGSGVNSYRQAGQDVAQTFDFFDGNLVITDHQILLMIMAVVLLVGLAAFLKYSRTGKSLRAVADNKDIAAILGINVNRTISIIFALGSALAAIAGMLIAGEQNLNPTMGLALNVRAFAAVVLGGVGNIYGALVGAVIIGFCENFLVAFTPIPPSFKEAIVFFILILMLFVRPNGILGANADADVRK